MAASKEADGKFWCELLSSDKYRDAENYKENTSSHHLSIVVRTSTQWVSLKFKLLQIGAIFLWLTQNQNHHKHNG